MYAKLHRIIFKVSRKATKVANKKCVCEITTKQLLL